WRNTRTQRNIRLLAEDPQVTLWGPDQGEQACGDTGPGRMLEPQVLADLVNGGGDGVLTGKRVVITAGPTREPIDPVRYITNHSSGKMGYALAAAARAAGARVVLISGPVSLAAPAGVEVRPVTTAEDMLAAAGRPVDAGCDIFIAAAAVADYRPGAVAEQKIKKSADNMTLALVRNPDTLATVAAREDAPYCVGFAAETTEVARYATDKMVRKKLAMIIANDVSQPGIGFNSDNNAVTVFWPGGQRSLGPAAKQVLAADLVQLIAERSSQGRDGAAPATQSNKDHP